MPRAASCTRRQSSHLGCSQVTAAASQPGTGLTDSGLLASNRGRIWRCQAHFDLQCAVRDWTDPPRVALTSATTQQLLKDKLGRLLPTSAGSNIMKDVARVGIGVVDGRHRGCSSDTRESCARASAEVAIPESQLGLQCLQCCFAVGGCRVDDPDSAGETPTGCRKPSSVLLKQCGRGSCLLLPCLRRVSGAFLWSSYG